MENAVAIGYWFESGGLYSLYGDLFFFTLKNMSIYFLLSLPFLFSIEGDSDAHIIWNPKSIGFFIYLSITYIIVGIVMGLKYLNKITSVTKASQYFIDNGLDIYNTHNITLDELVGRLQFDKISFLNKNTRIENFCIAFLEESYLDIKLPFFNNMLCTMPFETVFKEMVSGYYFNGSREYRLTSANAESFKTLCHRCGWISLPFIPAVFLFTVLNHILTYSGNGSLLSLSTFNRTGRWVLRYYNEMDNSLKNRLDEIHEDCENIISRNLSGIRKTLYRSFSFLSGACASFLLTLSIYGYERLFNLDILTMMAIFTAISALFFPRHIPSIKKNPLELSPTEIEKLFSNKGIILLKEALSILLLPVLFFWYLPDRSFMIANFFACYTSDGYCLYANSDNRDHSPKTLRSWNAIMSLPV